MSLVPIYRYKLYRSYLPTLIRSYAVRDREFVIAKWRLIGYGLDPTNPCLYRLDARTVKGIKNATIIEEIEP